MKFYVNPATEACQLQAFFFHHDIDKRVLGQQVKINSELELSGHYSQEGLSQARRIGCECFPLKTEDSKQTFWDDILFVILL